MNPRLSIYFADFRNSKLPQRKYLLNVANTVAEHSVVLAVREIRLNREDKGLD